MNKKIIIQEKEKIKKTSTKNWNNKDFLINAKNHIFIINKLYLQEIFEGNNIVQRELKKKISSYKQQDIKKKKFIADSFINNEELIEKLVISKLKCYYCKQRVLLVYEFLREMEQWTLDRLDNRRQHSSNNCVISCLKCNLQRRCLDDKKFRFTKQMNLIKKN